MRLHEYLDELEFFGIKLGLEQTFELMERLGRPDLRLKFIHIAGSNGKGSCGAILNCALKSAEFKVGFYTSPHLVDFNERIRIDGKAASDNELEVFFQKVYLQSELMRRSGRKVTYFEFVTVLAALYFAEKSCDFVVWETGMGGRFDATNVVTPEISIITNIALEHQQYLGDTLEKIAFEKAGIIKKNIPVFAGIMDEVPLQVIENVAKECNAPFQSVKSAAFDFKYVDFKQCFSYQGHPVKLNLAGLMQRRNFAVAALALEYLSHKFHFDFQLALSSLSEVSWPGRCQIVSPETIVDGAHNPDGVRALCDVLDECFPDEKFVVIFGAFKDKKIEESLRLLSRKAAAFIMTPIAYTHRPSFSAAELTTFIPSNIKVCPAENLSAALRIAQNFSGRQVVCGSLYLVGEFFKLNNFNLNSIS